MKELYIRNEKVLFHSFLGLISEEFALFLDIHYPKERKISSIFKDFFLLCMFLIVSETVDNHLVDFQGLKLDFHTLKIKIKF